MDSFLADDAECPEHLGFKRLLTAVLQRAILDYYPMNRTEIIDGEVVITSYDQRLAHDWLHDDSEDDWSYIWLCENLGICAEKVLEEVKKNYGFAISTGRHRVTRE